MEQAAECYVAFVVPALRSICEGGSLSCTGFIYSTFWHFNFETADFVMIRSNKVCVEQYLK